MNSSRTVLPRHGRCCYIITQYHENTRANQTSDKLGFVGPLMVFIVQTNAVSKNRSGLYFARFKPCKPCKRPVDRCSNQKETTRSQSNVEHASMRAQKRCDHRLLSSYCFEKGSLVACIAATLCILQSRHNCSRHLSCLRCWGPA